MVARFLTVLMLAVSAIFLRRSQRRRAGTRSSTRRTCSAPPRSRTFRRPLMRQAPSRGRPALRLPGIGHERRKR